MSMSQAPLPFPPHVDASAVELPEEGGYLLIHGAETEPDEHFVGPGSRFAALTRFKQVSADAPANLYVKCASNTEDLTVPDAQVWRSPAENPFEPHWPEGLVPGESYELPCDDKGRNGGSWLRVMVSEADNDVWLLMQDWEDLPEGEPNPIPSLRCRTLMGGGRHSRTHQALMNLANAIRLDREEAEGKRR